MANCILLLISYILCTNDRVIFVVCNFNGSGPRMRYGLLSAGKVGGKIKFLEYDERVGNHLKALAAENLFMISVLFAFFQKENELFGLSR